MNEEENSIREWIKGQINDCTMLIQSVSYMDSKKEYAKDRTKFKEVLNLIDKQQKEIEHQKEKRENQKSELAILNEKQIEFNKMKNIIKSYKGQFKRQEKEIDKQNKVIDYILNDYMAINEIRTIMGLPHSITTAEELKKEYFGRVEEDDKK